MSQNALKKSQKSHKIRFFEPEGDYKLTESLSIAYVDYKDITEQTNKVAKMSQFVWLEAIIRVWLQKVLFYRV